MKLDEDVNRIKANLEGKQEKFERVIMLSRKIIAASAQTITLLHNNEMQKAVSELKLVRDNIAGLQSIDAQFKYYTVQAYQEYVEASMLMQIKKDGTIPSQKSLGMDDDAYLLGMMDVVGELKREILESLRKYDTKTAERHFDLMKQIYDSTRSLRFAESIISGFRKKQDTARIQIENAGSEILMFKSRDVKRAR